MAATIPATIPNEAAKRLFDALRSAGVGHGVYKNADRIEAALAGVGDCDLLVARSDAQRFRKVLASHGAVRAKHWRLHDNSGAGREDWFVPLGNGAALHLDCAIGLAVGPKYHKRRMAMGLGDVSEWRIVEVAGVAVPVASPEDSARIAALRAAPPGKTDWPLPLQAVSFAKRAGHAIGARATKRMAGRRLDRRALLPRGAVVALIGPDGVGKSTQAQRLRERFGARFRTASVYLGSNDGGWTRFRRKIGRSRKPSLGSDSGSRKSPADRSWKHATGSAMFRLFVALQRLAGLRKAQRLARAGALVICDRWPQGIEPGILDGPALPPAPRHRLAGAISRMEHRIYARMDRERADLFVHLDCDFATSHARKPGDISQGEFARRLELMERLRQREADRPGAVAVVDARQHRDAVTAAIADAIWRALPVGLE